MGIFLVVSWEIFEIHDSGNQKKQQLSLISTLQVKKEFIKQIWGLLTLQRFTGLGSFAKERLRRQQSQF